MSTASHQAHFAPEFLNRVDETIIFKPLDQAQIRQVILDVERGVRDRLSGLEFGRLVPLRRQRLQP